MLKQEATGSYESHPGDTATLLQTGFMKTVFKHFEVQNYNTYEYFVKWLVFNISFMLVCWGLRFDFSFFFKCLSPHVMQVDVSDTR